MKQMEHLCLTCLITSVLRIPHVPPFSPPGFIPPTSGDAYVNGYSIVSNIENVRESLGLCPQHDVLFDTMTVEEHLIFFAKVKMYMLHTYYTSCTLDKFHLCICCLIYRCSKVLQRKLLHASEPGIEFSNILKYKMKSDSWAMTAVRFLAGVFT